MKGLKKLALASAVLAVSTGAFAMEALQDDALSSTTGQAGLTITTNNTSITAAAIRYYDSDGATGASAAYGVAASPVYITSDGTSTGTALPGPCGGITNVACVANFSTAGGSVNINGFQLTEGASTTTIDVGSTGLTSTDTSGLLIGATANNLTVVLGGISIDNGDELNGALTGGTAGAATNAATYTGGYLTGGKDLGGLALSGINLPKSLMLISAGAADLGALTGNNFNSGLTITSLIPITDLSLTVSYYNTATEKYTAGSGFTPQTGSAANDGIVTLPINLIGVLTGPIEIGVGKAAGTGYATGAGEGLDILMTGTGITAVDLGGQGANIAGIGGTAGSGIQIAGSSVGSIGILKLVVGPQMLSISGH